ncbi:transcription termination factor 5, mitochondrial-like [Ostrinia nubilalis]|uniref:transcription termination factor 5, mitochondrial-like n=1 Tax=Ostrinia nubilalis TaxID=29057 RepID=UPI00308232CE
MWCNRRIFRSLRPCQIKYSFFNFSYHKCYHKMPFLDFYEKTTGQSISEHELPFLTKKHPNIESLTHDGLQYTLQILGKFGITPSDACANIHLFSMNPISVDNYGEILKECGFVNIEPKHIIRYHTIVRSRTISELKKQGLMNKNFSLEQALLDCFQEWPSNCKTLQNFSDYNTSILAVRMGVLEKYLHWRLKATPEDFQKYCKNYLPLKHKPMSDIKEALNLAQNEIKFDVELIRRNGFVISTDPIRTKLILENVDTLAGMDIREAIRVEPGLLKNNHIALLEVKSLLEEYEISTEAQQRCLRVFCMRAQTVKERLDELRQLKEYQLLASNPRILTLVVHKRKMMSRLTRIQAAKKQCYSLNNLVSSSKVFNNFISGFGNKVCGRDIAILISSAVHGNSKMTTNEAIRDVAQRLKRHKYWLHAALSVVDENLRFLKTKFNNDIILNHCQILLYPISEIEYYLDHFLKIRNGDIKIQDYSKIQLDATYNSLKPGELTDSQILSLVLYEMEKKYHFSGDGIWARQEGGKAESQRI